MNSKALQGHYRICRGSNVVIFPSRLFEHDLKHVLRQANQTKAEASFQSIEIHSYAGKN